LPPFDREARSDTDRSINPYLAKPHHAALLEKLKEIKKRFESSPFNRYEGQEEPELLIICGGNGLLCASEAVEMLGLQDRVGILKVSALWPFPSSLITAYLKKATKILVVEEVDPFIEGHVKEALADAHLEGLEVYGRQSGHIPEYGEITLDSTIRALAEIFGLEYRSRGEDYTQAVSEVAKDLVISRGLTWCAGCPHRASFWALERAVKADGRDAFVTGDIGCYTLDVFPEGKEQINVLHAMGSGSGLAVGFGQLDRFKYTQPVIAICGDSTFYHASIPALINAVYNGSNMVQIVLDNAATAMTGFQSHPGTGFNAVGESAPRIDVEMLCRSLGCEVAVSDPFDVKGTIKTMRKLLKRENGVRVLILRRRCEIVRMREEKFKPYEIEILEEKCKGQECSVCSSAFRCPALYQDPDTGKTRIKKEICVGCGVCVEICPFKAIKKEGRTP